ncbi:ribose-5-phosphate isomerase B [Ameyamaea chiangmaiensis NBRC 103196]|uniref:RpiB/LacA/LacB family sugar-phosphate isomerase n=1 Tax=Ameyamaea chiangmaiensis TaxID=442969 RepID=A0A850P587_9PROT|nr:RpiB/LacA/LacB family sugar-phosphate isomerase [Ameyamaea chiangmaiensis]MBS4075504.1 RpiB/LacA/LacB family sugar-phosphate isomerase [Ameyamaea chiangmaiensis]NVN38964.1 RpiB/LacA/LacB family sugar-phosphate isomerase [Ameyamaea chiangmaiensis]GBQ69505.1 ribose-5-phosphate isomerase B [Ameyamaea chiangmaiensis NBRC 103196]
MRIAVAGDSAGAGLAKILAEHLGKKGGLTVVDLSVAPDGSAELYAGLSERVGLAILAGEFDRGILCCGTGIGVCMSANKIPGIRAAQTHDTYSAERAALSNDAHIITMGARVIGLELAKVIAEAWLAKTFDPASPSAKNVAGVDALARKYAVAHE